MIFSMSFSDGGCHWSFRRAEFQYKNREYVLYPGTGRYYMAIDTWVKDNRERDQAFTEIHEFLYLYGWENQCYFHFIGGGTLGAGNLQTLRERRKPVVLYPRWPINTEHLMYMADPAGASEDFINAISLYNDARCSIDIFHQFNCFYKILDLPVKGKTRKPADWIREHIDDIEIKISLDPWVTKEKKVEDWIRDDCRNAIAHIHRGKSLKPSVISYRFEDFEMIRTANYVLEKLVEYFIKSEIGEPGLKYITDVKVERG